MRWPGALPVDPLNANSWRRGRWQSLGQVAVQWEPGGAARGLWRCCIRLLYGSRASDRCALEGAADSGTNVDLQGGTNARAVAGHEEMDAIEVGEHPVFDDLGIEVLDCQPRPQDRVGQQALRQSGNRPRGDRQRSSQINVHEVG